jgi:hypothetical protein
MKPSITLLAALLLAPLAAIPAADAPAFDIKLETISRGYDGKTCWVHPRAGAIPGSTPRIVLTMQKLMLSGSDVFFALNEMRTDDVGATWRGPTEHAETLGRRTEADGSVVAACNFWPKWHAKSGKLLGIGQALRYRNDKVLPDHASETAWSIYDPQQRTWTPWSTLAMPDDPKFIHAAAGCVQRLDLPDGDILLPIYFTPRGQKFEKVTVLRCTFDGSTLRFAGQGNELALDTDRGLSEPSLTRFGDTFFLTLRHDRSAYVTTSKDGLHFDQPQEWRWDDGTTLGSYNTQAHWVTHSDSLFLVYTRKGANNDHVFRHRAPLFIAQVDPKKLRVIRGTERVLVPERGARLGNFGVTEVSENETWVTVAEWMQSWSPNFIMKPDNKYGADNSVYTARIQWKTPNKSWDQH